jgi:hypothetical protein
MYVIRSPEFSLSTFVKQLVTVIKAGSNMFTHTVHKNHFYMYIQRICSSAIFFFKEFYFFSFLNNYFFSLYDTFSCIATRNALHTQITCIYQGLFTTIFSYNSYTRCSVFQRRLLCRNSLAVDLPKTSACLKITVCVPT